VEDFGVVVDVLVSTCAWNVLVQGFVLVGEANVL